MARRLGYLDVPDDLILSLQDINRLPPHQVTIMATGAQGEPRSIMGRLATGRHPSLRVVPGDTVVLSSHTIPGNEEIVHRVINRLFQKGANVVYSPIAPVHVSGHASQEEQKMLLNIVRPKFFVPIHGELRHLKQHALLAQEIGIPRQNIAAVENGYILRFSEDSLEIGERVPGGYVFVDGTLVGDAVSPQIIQDRESLAVAGVCSVVFSYNRRQGVVIGEPRITARGLATAEVLEDLAARAQPVVRNTVQATRGSAAPDEVERAVERAVSNFFHDQVQSRPEMIVVAVPLG